MAAAQDALPWIHFSFLLSFHLKTFSLSLSLSPYRSGSKNLILFYAYEKGHFTV